MSIPSLRYRAIEPTVILIFVATLCLNFISCVSITMSSASNETSITNAESDLTIFQNTTIAWLRGYRNVVPNSQVYFYIALLVPLLWAVYLLCNSFFASVIRLLNYEITFFNDYCHDWVKELRAEVHIPNRSALSFITDWHTR